MAVVEIAIPPRPAYVSVVRLALASLARTAGMEEEAVDDLRIAVGEACANAVLGRADGGGDERISVRWSHDVGHIVVEIGDGEGDPPLTEAPDPTDSSGYSTRVVMSTALLQSLVDECELVEYEGGRLYARLVVNLPATI